MKKSLQFIYKAKIPNDIISNMIPNPIDLIGYSAILLNEYAFFWQDENVIIFTKKKTKTVRKTIYSSTGKKEGIVYRYFNTEQPYINFDETFTDGKILETYHLYLRIMVARRFDSFYSLNIFIYFMKKSKRTSSKQFVSKAPRHQGKEEAQRIDLNGSAIITYQELGRPLGAFKDRAQCVRRLKIQSETLKFWASDASCPPTAKVNWKAMSKRQRIMFNAGWVNPNFKIEFIS